MEKIKLEVLGLSYSQTQAGAYALILAVENDTQRIPIIIGGFEAQSIALQLENLKPPRPLTHDLFTDFANTYNINLTEILIYKLEEGIFYSKMYFQKSAEDIKIIEARTSDAVALALRFNIPIYTTVDIVEKAGIVLSFKEEDAPMNLDIQEPDDNVKYDYSSFDTKDLEELMGNFIQNEEYEKASLIRDELNRRKSESE
jgi:bifunctional DNase/RNase